MENFCVARLQSWRSGSRISLMVQARILLASIRWEWSSLLRDDISALLARYYIAYANARMEVMDGRQNDWKRNNNCSSLIQYIFFSAPVCHTIHRMRCVRKTFETDCFVGRTNLSRPSCLRVDIQRLNRNQLNCCLYRVQLGCVALRHNRCKWSGCYRSSGIRTNKMIFLNFIIMDILVSMIHAFVSWFCYEADCRIVYVQLSGFGNCVLDSVDIKFFYTTRINVHSETWANVTCPMSMINHTHNLNEENKIDWKSNTRWENSADKTVMLDVANEKKNFQFDGYVNIKSPILTYLVTVRIKTDDYSRSLQHMSVFQLTIFDCRVSTSLHRQTVDVCYYDWEVAFGCHEHIWLHCKIIGY